MKRIFGSGPYFCNIPRRTSCSIGASSPKSAHLDTKVPVGALKKIFSVGPSIIEYAVACTTDQDVQVDQLIKMFVVLFPFVFVQVLRSLIFLVPLSI